MTQKVSGDMLETGAVVNAPTGLTAGNYTRVASDGTLEERTPSQVQADIGAAASTGAALTKNDDTNVTATLTGNPTNGLLRAINIALGWTGLLSVARGGTGLGSYTAGNYINAASSSSLQQRTPAQVRSDLSVDTSSSGTYTPTITGITNVSGSSSNLIQWMRVGNVVTVSGFVSVTATATGSTEFELSLPVASDFTQTYQCSGGGANSETTLSPVHIIADVANNRAQLTFNAGVSGGRAITFSFTYLVL